ncbi:RNA-binding protein Cwf29 [Polyrhizophydium stewartii]|uniref:RNA-binding protein Cwf29 n=1 Tax=Polyrhizophydium stewartii TaxID=2732419 RepID=A0ABR4NHH2_9FUNG
MNNIKQIERLNAIELERGLTDRGSWHSQFEDSAYIYVGGLPYQMTEGDVICIFSQYGEIVDVDLVRDKESGKSKGFAFVAYEDQRSTVLAVDNFNGTQMLGRTLRVDHARYRGPKRDDNFDEAAEYKRKQAILPPHLRDPDPNESSDSESEPEEQAAQPSGDPDLEDPMAKYLAAEKKKKKNEKQKKENKDKKHKKDKKDKKDKRSKRDDDADADQRDDGRHERGRKERHEDRREERRDERRRDRSRDRTDDGYREGHSQSRRRSPTRHRSWSPRRSSRRSLSRSLSRSRSPRLSAK